MANNKPWAPSPNAMAKLEEVARLVGMTPLPDSFIAEMSLAVKAANHALHHGCVGPQIERILLEGEG